MLALRTAFLAAALAAASPGFATTLLTGSAGQGQAFSQYQPSLALTQLVATTGIFPPRDPTQPNGGEVATNSLGMIRTFAGNYSAFEAPKAQGQVLEIRDNTALFSILGTDYGGDGEETYALPNLVGRTVIGTGQGPGLANYTLGQMTGADSTILSIANLPPHAHGLPGGGATSIVGGLTPFDTQQPSLAMTHMIAVSGVFPGGGAPSSMIGAMGVFAGSFAPSGWMPADGRMLNILDYDALWTLIGTTYGGDGQTTFALPDLRGRAIVGTGQATPLGLVGLGDVFGTTQLFLTPGNMPTHDHDLQDGGTTDPAGDGTPFTNVQPSLGLNYIINVQGIFPGQNDGDGAVPHDTPFLGEIIALSHNLIPNGWLPADGRLLPINQNQALFAIMGITYGGDGRTTFALPDLRGRLIVGTGQGFDFGMQLGQATTTLTEANLPAHVHSYDVADVIPEPTTWAMMIGGFGLVGAAMRRRRLAVA